MASFRVEAFFEADTGSFSYVVADQESRECAVIDPVVRYVPETARIDVSPAQKIADRVDAQGYKNRWLLETHVHADHVTGAAYLREILGGEMAIGSGVHAVLSTFVPLFNLQGQVATDGSQYQYLLDDGVKLPLGEQCISVMHTPGHTPACVSYLIGDALFVGFMPDLGTARCDFPGGDTEQLYQSIQRLYALPDETRVYVCHDYLTETRQQHACQTTIGKHKAENVHLSAQTSANEFNQLRRQRDQSLMLPRLMLPAVQLNLQNGAIPQPSKNGKSYLNIPLNVF